MISFDDDLQRLRTLIDDLAEQGAAQLPPEPKLAEQANVTRGRLRTLLKRLEADGSIWRHVGKGTFVGPRKLDPSPSSLSLSLSLGDIMDTRQLIEPQLAAQAAVNAKPKDIAALEACQAEMRSTTTSYQQWKRLDDRLHRLIAEATHNGLLLLLYETLRAHGAVGLDGRIGEVFGNDAQPSETNRQHEAIILAIKSGNPDRAEAEMRAHLQSIRALLFGLR